MFRGTYFLISPTTQNGHVVRLFSTENWCIPVSESCVWVSCGPDAIIRSNHRGLLFIQSGYIYRLLDEREGKKGKGWQGQTCKQAGRNRNPLIPLLQWTTCPQLRRAMIPVDVYIYKPVNWGYFTALLIAVCSTCGIYEIDTYVYK